MVRIWSTNKVLQKLNILNLNLKKLKTPIFSLFIFVTLLHKENITLKKVTFFFKKIILKFFEFGHF